MKAGTAKKVLKRVALVVALLPVVAIVLVVATFFALRLPPVESAVLARVNPLLGTIFEGRIVLERVTGVSLTGANLDGYVLDPAGRKVIVLRGASAKMAWPRFVWDVLHGANPLVVDLEEVSVHDAVVHYIDAGDGSPTLAAAFTPKKSDKPEPPGPSTETKVFVRKATIDHTWVYGGLSSGVVLDADISAFAGSVNVDGQGWHVAVDGTQLKARALPMAVDPAGSFKGTIGGSLVKEGPPDATAKFDGTALGTKLVAEASFQGGVLTVTADAPDVSPAVVAQLVPGLAFKDSSRVSARVNGVPPDLTATAEVQSGDAAVRVEAEMKAKGKRLEAKVQTAKVDVSRFVPDAPATSVDATAKVDLTLPGDGRLDGKYSATIRGARVEGELVPDLELEGKVSLDVPTWKVNGTAEIAERGAPTDVAYELTGNQASTEVVVDLESQLKDPPRLKELAGVSTSGRVHAMARLSPEKKTFTARVNAQLGHTTAPSVTAGGLTVDGAATGSFDNPILDVTASARALALPGGRVFERAKVRANGKLARAKVEAELAGKAAEIRLYGTVSGTPSLSVEDPAITLVDKQGVVRIGTKRVAVNGKRIQVDGLTVDGAGHAEGSFVYDGELRRVQFESKDLDVQRLLKIAEVQAQVPGGKVSLVASYAEDRGKPAALVRGTARQLEYDKVKNGFVELDLTLEDRVVSGKGKVELGKGADIWLTLTDVTFDGPITNPKLDTVRGQATMDIEADMEKLGMLYKLRGVPIETAKGKIDGAVVIERMRTDRLPRVTVHVATDSLELVGKRPQVEKLESASDALAATPWALRGVDIEVTAEGGGDAHDLSLRGRIVDDQAEAPELAAVEAFVELPPGATRPSEVIDHLEHARGRVNVRMAPRRFRQLPELIRPRAVGGTMSFVLEADGTMNEPHVNVFGDLKRFGASGQRLVDEESVRVDVGFAADYRKSGGKVDVGVSYKGKTTADLKAKWTGDALEIAKMESGPSPIVGQVDLAVDSFPLDVIPQAKNRQIGGVLSGKVALSGLGKDAQASGKLEIKPLELGQTTLESFGISLETKGEQVETKAWAQGDGGKLEARVSNKFAWKNKLLPVMDPNLSGHVSAKRFRLAAISPFLAGLVSEVDGRIDAELDAKLENEVPFLAGHAEFDSGSLSIPVIGQEMSGIRGKFVLSPRQAKLTDFYAKGVTGALTATATVDFAEKFQLAGARAEVNIAEKDRLPLTLEGVTLGDAWGKIEATLKKDAATEETRVVVSVPKLHVDLPSLGATDVQTLDADPHVRIGAVRTDGEFVIVPTQPLESKPSAGGTPTVTVVEVKLGKITLNQGEQVRIELTGNINARSAEKLQLTGQIQTTGGQLDVQGKRFEVERGTITFDGESPPNPTIVAVARWDSPAGYRVYAEYSGTAKKAKLRLRAEPSLSSDQVMSLLVLGTPDGSQGSRAGQQGIGFAGGEAAKGINRALSDLTDLDIQARVDTSTGVARPEVVIQISPRVAARVTRAIGDPLPGMTPDRTFLTFDFQVRAHWLLSTLVGDRGASALDLLWRIRY